MSGMAKTVSDPFTPAEIQRYYAIRMPRMVQKGREWRAACVLHGGKRNSFAVDPPTGLWMCHSQCGRGGSIFDFEMAVSGMDFKRAAVEVRRLIGRPEDRRDDGGLGRITAIYDYIDVDGTLLYQVLRFDPKDFRQRRPDGYGGWVWRKSEHQVLYRLREVMEAPIVFVVEGEKDVEILRSQGFIATTNAGGAKAPWLPQFTEALRGKEVIVIPDNDGDGWQRALTIARELLGHVVRLRIFDLPKDVKDISDWFAAGHSECEFIAMLEGCHAV